jgi:hypothetical protein
MEEDSIPTTSYSHAVVHALDTEWDIQGGEAKERWEAYWLQTDAESETESTFEWMDVRQNNIFSALDNLISGLGGNSLEQRLQKEAYLFLVKTAAKLQ